MKHLFIGERDFGSYFENCVYLGLRRHQSVFYVLEGGVELDFLTEDDTLVEAKYNSQIEGKQLQLFEGYQARRKVVVDSVPALSELDELWEA